MSIETIFAQKAIYGISEKIDFQCPDGTLTHNGVPIGGSSTIAVGSTTTLSAGSPATVVNAGTPSAAVLNFGIPQGLQGVVGTAATIAVGSTTTLSPGSPATVVNSGSPSAAVLNFGIPQSLPPTLPGVAVVPAVSFSLANNVNGNVALTPGTYGPYVADAVGVTLPAGSYLIDYGFQAVNVQDAQVGFTYTPSVGSPILFADSCRPTYFSGDTADTHVQDIVTLSVSMKLVVDIKCSTIGAGNASCILTSVRIKQLL
jgi:hypothetical protein